MSESTPTPTIAAAAGPDLADESPSATAIRAIERALSNPGRHPDIEAALIAADRDGADWLLRVKLRNAVAWQWHLAGDRVRPLELLERTVGELRGRGDTAEGFALCGLGASYSNLERSAEAIVSLQRAARLFRSLGSRVDEVRALVMLSGAAVLCDAWPVVDRLAIPIYMQLGDLPPAVSRWARKHIQGYAIDAALHSGLGLSTLLLTDHIETFLGDERSSEEFATQIPITRALMYAAVGRFDEAERRLGESEQAGTPPPEYRAQLLLVRARARAADGDLDRARGLAIESLDSWVGPARDASHGRLFRHATRVGEFLLNVVGDHDAAERTFDLAATAVVRRLRELDDAFSQVPELRDASAEDLALVAECREWARRSTGAEIATIRRAFEKAARSGGDDVLTRLATSQGPRALCAWCGSVRTGDDRWLPIADHLPPEDEVTHGICPPCRAKAHAELESHSAL